MTIVNEQQNDQEPKNIKRFRSSESSIPPEIFVDVFLKLRVPSLLRCKSVCKLWQSLISDPHFVKSHLMLSTRNNDYAHHYRLVLFSKVPKYSFKSYSFYDVMHDNSVDALEGIDFTSPNTSSSYFPFVVGSCNGLLCLLDGCRNVYIWNPSTGRSKRFQNTCYDFNTSRRGCGFGYEKSSHDYKFVFVYSDSCKETKVWIYSLKTGKWKDISHFPHGYSLFSSYTFSNGAFHWLAHHRVGSSSSLRILSLDLANETYSEVLQPMYEDPGREGLTLGNVGEWLCLVCNYARIRSDVWVMKVYGVKESWTKVVSIPYQTNDLGYFRRVPLCISDDGNVLLRFIGKLALYNSKNNSFTKIWNTGGLHRPYIFVESLVSPDVFDDVD